MKQLKSNEVIRMAFSSFIMNNYNNYNDEERIFFVSSDYNKVGEV